MHIVTLEMYVLTDTNNMYIVLLYCIGELHYSNIIFCYINAHTPGTYFTETVTVPIIVASLRKLSQG